MKNLLVLLFLSLTINISAQMQEYIGTYENRFDSDDGMYTEYSLSLNEDGTFLFHNFDDQLCYSTEINVTGQWKVEDGEIIFYNHNEETPDGIENFDFTNTKAELQKGVIKIYDSKTDWLNGLELNFH